MQEKEVRLGKEKTKVHGEIADVKFVSFDNEPHHGQTTRVDTFLQDVNIPNPTTESRPQYQYTLNGARNEMYLRGRCWIQGSNRALIFLKCLEFCGDGTVCETARDYMIRLPIGNISNASNTEQGKRDDQRTCTVILKSPGFPPKDRRKCKNDDTALDVDTAENIMHGRPPSVPAHLRDTAERLPRARYSLSLSEMSPPSRPIQVSLMLLPSVVGISNF